MATKVPRIQVTLSAEAYDLVTRLADLQKGSRSAIIADLVNELAPQLRAMLELVEKAAAIRSDKLRQVGDAGRDLLDRLQPHADAAAQHWLELERIIEAGADEGGPPSSNTGVTSDLSARKRSSRAPGKSKPKVAPKRRSGGRA